jgi:antitoxin PrlF
MVEGLGALTLRQAGAPRRANGLFVLGKGRIRVRLTGAIMSATVTSKVQITIPKRVRDLLGIEPGSRVDFERAPDGRIVLVKAGKKGRASRFARLRGHAGKGLSTDAIMAMTRGER